MNGSLEHQIIPSRPQSRTSRLIVAGLFSSALILGAGAAWADGDDHGYGHDPKSHLEHLTKKLDLTKEQQDKILPIIEDKHKKMEALHNQMKEIRQQAMSQIEAELTPDQQAKWKEMQEKRKEKMKEYREKHEKGEGHGKDKHGKDKD
ncbi:MAG: Spy/CpxP family protein refolding chaperone [Nitrospirales bacterium]|nr:periplasmic heavy metal sensor [Nitrospirales bacterium]